MSIGLEKTEIVALVLECFFFGIYTTLFSITCWILITKSFNGYALHPLVLTACTMYLMAISHLCIDVRRAVSAFVDDANMPNGSLTVYGQLNSALEVAKTSIYAVQTILADSFCVWRCYIVWQRSWPVIVFPIIMVFGTAVATSGVCWELSRIEPGSPVFGSIPSPWITFSFVMTLITNIICTGLIAFKIWRSKRWLKYARVFSKLSPVMIMVIESGAIYSCALISAIATYASGNNAQYIVIDFVPSLIGVVFTVIILRVGLGISSNGSHLSESRLTFVRNNESTARKYQSTNYPMKPMTFPITVDVHEESTVYTV